MVPVTNSWTGLFGGKNDTKVWVHAVFHLKYSLQGVYIQFQYCEFGMLRMNSNDLRETAEPSMNSFTAGFDDKRKNGHSTSSKSLYI